MTSLFKYPHKYLYVVSFIFHLLETTILSKSTESNRVACFDEENCFFINFFVSKFYFFKLIFIVCMDKNFFFFFLLYNVPFSPIITAFLIKLYASFLLIDAKLTR